MRKILILYILSGLPGSGKSTRAFQLVSQTGAILVSRDELRVSYRNLRDEAHLTRALAANAHFFLNLGYDVVVDSWNLEEWDEALWQGVAAEHEADMRWYHIEADVDVCVSRDAKRPQPIGPDCIKGAAEVYGSRLTALREKYPLADD